MNPFIPFPDSLPIPAPGWLVQLLLMVTFIVHVIFMNCLLGGSVAAAYSYFKGKKDPFHAHLAGQLYRLLPIIIAFTVTMGVAPLLFLQLLYGHFMYTSSILMAYAWFAVVPLVIAGYYIAYYLRFKYDNLAQSGYWFTLTMAIIFAVVGFIYVNNMTLMLRPETWGEHYFQNMTTGALNWADPQVYPRYLHIFLGALAVTGILIMFAGLRSKSADSEQRQWMVKTGSKLFVYSTSINIAAGIWFLLSLPKPVMMIFMGQSILATVLLVTSLLLTASVVYIIFKAGRANNSRSLTYVGAGHLIVLLSIMAVMRELVRRAFLEPYFSVNQLQAEPQWGIISVFIFLFIAGLAAVGWMVHTYLKTAATQT